MSGMGNGVSVEIEEVGSGAADGDDESPHAASTSAAAATPASVPALRMKSR